MTTDYKRSCANRVTMYRVNRVLDSFCDFICKARDCGRISAEDAERQTDAAADIELAVMDHEATAETWEAFEKIRAFNRKHNLAA